MLGVLRNQTVDRQESIKAKLINKHNYLSIDLRKTMNLFCHQICLDIGSEINTGNC